MKKYIVEVSETAEQDLKNIISYLCIQNFCYKNIVCTTTSKESGKRAKPKRRKIEVYKLNKYYKGCKKQTALILSQGNFIDYDKIVIFHKI